jgi:hypothetical protein
MELQDLDVSFFVVALLVIILIFFLWEFLLNIDVATSLYVESCAAFYPNEFALRELWLECDSLLVQSFTNVFIALKNFVLNSHI